VVLLEGGPAFMALLASFARLYGDQKVVPWGIGQPVSGKGLSYFFIGLGLAAFAWQGAFIELVGAAVAAGAGLLLGGGQISPLDELRRRYRQWRARVKRQKYKVIDGGLFTEPRHKPSEKRWIN
jgi:hypothetical protein